MYKNYLLIIFSIICTNIQAQTDTFHIKVVNIEALRQQDATPGLKFEEIYDPKPITFENSIKQASKDRLVSHYKEDSCRKCEYYLICDGFKK